MPIANDTRLAANVVAFSADNVETSPPNNTINAPKYDYRGNIRPNPSGSNPDLGAHENSLASSPYPGQVTDLHFTPGNQTIDLHWNRNPEKDIEKYEIYMSTVKDFIPSATDSIGSTPDTTYFVKGLNNNTEYFFRVAAKDSTGYLGDYSEQLAAIPKYNGPEWFVSNEGNDNGNGDQLSPLRSIRAALDKASPGHTIRITSGTYTGNDNVGIEVKKDISFIGDGPNSTILDAQKSNFHFRFNNYDDSSGDPNNTNPKKVYFSGLKFVNSSVG